MARFIGAFHLSGNESDSDETMTLDKQAIRVPQSFNFLTRLISLYSARVNTSKQYPVLLYIPS